MQSKYTLLQCASPDAIARLPATELKHDAEKLWREYFINQEHGSLKDYLVHCLGNVDDTEYDGSLVQVSFSLYHIVVIHLKFWMILVSFFEVVYIIVTQINTFLMHANNYFFGR